jgi:transposase
MSTIFLNHKASLEDRNYGKAQLDQWLTKVTASQIRELQSFVLGVERDKSAVVAGLTLPQNNGLVEGKVNKLKLIKRMMYGKAEFPRLTSARTARLVERNLSHEKIYSLLQL